MNTLKIIVIVLTLAIVSPAIAQFRASTISTEAALTRIRSQALSTKAFIQRYRTLMAAATVDSTVPLALVAHLSQTIPTLTALSGTPGLAAYAQAQLNDPTYDIVVEYTAMRTALVNLRNNLISTFPTLGGTGVPPVGGFLAYEQLDASGVRTTRTFNAAQLAAAVALMDLAIATIQ